MIRYPLPEAQAAIDQARASVPEDLRERVTEILHLIGSVPCKPKPIRGWRRTLWEEMRRLGLDPDDIVIISVYLVNTQEESERLRELLDGRRAAAKKLFHTMPSRRLMKALESDDPLYNRQLRERAEAAFMEPRKRIRRVEILLAEEYQIYPGRTKPPERVLDRITHILVWVFQSYSGRPWYPIVGQLLHIAGLDSVDKEMTQRDRYRKLGEKARDRLRNKQDDEALMEYFSF